MVDCDAHPDNSACEKPVGSILKTLVPVCIFGFIFMGALIVFFFIMRKRRIQDAAAEAAAQQKYRDLGFDDDEPVNRKKKGGALPPLPRQPMAGTPRNNRQSTGPGNFLGEQQNPGMYLRETGSSYQLSQLHPSLDQNQKAQVPKEMV